MNIPGYPESGKPVEALWGRQVVDCLRALRVSVRWPLRLTPDTSCTMLEYVGPAVQQAEAGLDLSKFCFGFTISGAVVTIKAGDWSLGESDDAELSDTPVTISVDHQYVGLEVNTVAKTIKVIGPSTNKAFFKPEKNVFRTWLHQFRFNGTSASFERTHLGSIHMPGRFGV
jgi:hypothetical protein